MKPRVKTIVSHILAFILTVSILYLPTLSFSFVLDDHAGVEKNVQIRSLERIVENPRSIIRLLTSHLSYRIGGIDPAAFRIVNILFHLGNVSMLYLLLRRWASSQIAFVGGMLVAVHPLLIEPVVWISSVTYPQYSFFLLLSLYLYLRYGDRRNVPYLVFSYGSYCLALLTSEKAFIMPMLIFLYQLLFESVRRTWRILMGYLVLSGLLTIYVLAGFHTRVESFASSAVTGTVEWINPVQQIPYVLGTYLRLAFWPDRLTVYQFDERGFAYPEMIWYALLLFVFVAVLIYLFRRHRDLFFFFVAFVIASLPGLLPYHIIQIGAERYAYLGVLFLIGGIMIGANKIAFHLQQRKLLSFFIVAGIVITYFTRSMIRLQDWQSEMTLRQSVLRVAPYSARAYNNIGIQYMNDGQYEDALRYYKESIRLNNSYSHPYHNIGHMLALAKRYQEALRFYKKAYDLNSHEWKTRQDMGQVLFLLGRNSEAVPHLKYAIEKGSPDAQNLQRILDRINSYEP